MRNQSLQRLSRLQLHEDMSNFRQHHHHFLSNDTNTDQMFHSSHFTAERKHQVFLQTETDKTSLKPLSTHITHLNDQKLRRVIQRQPQCPLTPNISESHVASCLNRVTRPTSSSLQNIMAELIAF